MTKPPRRWYSFSLRALLLLVVAVAVPLGWALHNVREQERAAARFRERGCLTEFDVDLTPTALETLRSLFGAIERRSVVQVFGPGSQVTDATLEYLPVFPQLRFLDIDRTQVTDAGLVHLVGLSQLKFLGIGGTQVTDQGLENLRGLTNLECLYLERTKISDAGLAHLRGLKSLKQLSLKGTDVTDGGVEEIRQALPGCTVYR